MKSNVLFLFFFCLFIIRSLSAESTPNSSLVTPIVNGVNILSGELITSPSPTFQSTLYEIGKNNVANQTIHLNKGDSRIGKIKSIAQPHPQTSQLQTTAYFIYQEGATEVFDIALHKSTYRYNNKKQLTAIEHHQSLPGNKYHLYRCERLYWDPHSNRLTSRVLADSNDVAHVCCHFQYNSVGQLIKETLFGNLSGQCLFPLIIDENGSPLSNGVESYSKFYTYSSEDSSLLICQSEDNGTIYHYAYDPQTKQCVSKCKGDQHGIKSRQFYHYDSLGFLSRTIADDGKSLYENDLAGITARKTMSTELHVEGPILGQPRVTENYYLDLNSKSNILIEKIIYTYSEKGYLAKKEYYDNSNTAFYQVQMNYDDSGNILSTVDSRGETVDTPEENSKQRYDDFFQPVALIDKFGNETQYVYDDFGRVIKTIFPAILDANDSQINPTTTNEYDIRNNCIKMTDANGRTTTMTYNIRNKPVKIVYPDGTSESFLYFTDGELKQKVGKNGQTTSFEKDAFGRVLQCKECASDGTLLKSLSYVYRGGYLTGIKCSDGTSTKFAYDGAGRKVSVTTESSDGIKKKTYSYNNLGELSETKEWFGANSDEFVTKLEVKDIAQSINEIYLKDSAGNIQKKVTTPVENHSPHTIHQDHVFKNNRQQYVKQQEIIKDDGSREVITYDALGRMENITSLDAYGKKCNEKEIRFDGVGNKTRETYIALSNGTPIYSYTICWNYDAGNHITSILEGRGSEKQKSTLYNYDAFGRAKEIVYPNGKSIYYVYDSAGHLIRFTSSDHSFDYGYRYDSAHRLTEALDYTLSCSYQRLYDHFGNLLEEKGGIANHSLKSDYDLSGRRLKLTLPDGSAVSYHFQGALLKEIERLNPRQYSLYKHFYEYEPLTGRIVKQHLIGNVGTVDYSWDSLGRPQTISSPWWSETIPTGGFDKSDQLINLSIQDPGGEIKQTFSYSSNQQLCEEQGYFNHAYQNDSLNNHLAVDNQPNLHNELNQLLDSKNCKCHYDLNGNLTQKTSEKATIYYEYDALNRLTKITKDKELSLEFVYDPFHRRIAQYSYTFSYWRNKWVIANKDFFIHDGDKEIGTTDEQGYIKELRILGQGKGAEIGSSVALELNGNLYAPIHDHFGSIRCLIDVNTSTAAEYYRYSAFGTEEIFNTYGAQLDQSAIGNPWRFSSKRTVETVSLVFFGNRDYDPLLRRWTTPDPLLFNDGPNLYGFAKNNPLAYYDPHGFSVMSTIWGVISGVFHYMWGYLEDSSKKTMSVLKSELYLPEEMVSVFEAAGNHCLGERTMILLGCKIENPHIGSYGHKIHNEKVRITFVNGVLTTNDTLMDSLELISKTHDGEKVRYLFRPTEGWSWDMDRAMLLKFGFTFGIRSKYSYMLAEMWKSVINEMGGIHGGGTIIHYAHSLGGTETDRARDLLTPEEQKMIRVITIGSATLVRNEGFQSVINHATVNDGVTTIFDPMGIIRNIYDPNSNVAWHDERFILLGRWPWHHILCGSTYSPLVHEYGDRFLAEFAR